LSFLFLPSIPSCVFSVFFHIFRDFSVSRVSWLQSEQQNIRSSIPGKGNRFFSSLQSPDDSAGHQIGTQVCCAGAWNCRRWRCVLELRLHGAVDLPPLPTAFMAWYVIKNNIYLKSFYFFLHSL
jgi:hypothetical protein